MQINRVRTLDQRVACSVVMEINYPQRTYLNTKTTYSIAVQNGMKKTTSDVGKIPYPKGKKGVKPLQVRVRSPYALVLNPFKIVSTSGAGGLGRLHDYVQDYSGGPSWNYYMTAYGDLLAKFAVDDSLWPVKLMTTEPCSARPADLATARAYAKLSQPTHDFGTTLGELRETVAMLTHPLESLVKLSGKFGLLNGTFKQVMHKGFNEGLAFIPHSSSKRKRMIAQTLKDSLHGKKVINDLSNFWLEYRFGVRPLLQDIKSLLDLYANKNNLISNSGIRRVGAKVEQKMYSALTDTAGYVTLASFKISYKEKVDIVSRHNSNVYFVNKWNMPWLGYFSSVGFSPFQLPSLLWELTPLSFVVDRFINIGDFIGSVSPNPAIKVLGNCLSRKIDVTLDRWPTKAQSVPSGLYIPFGSIDHYKFQMSSLNRIIDYPLPMTPSVTVNMLSLSQLVDHATLLWQRLPRLK